MLNVGRGPLGDRPRECQSVQCTTQKKKKKKEEGWGIWDKGDALLRGDKHSRVRCTSSEGFWSRWREEIFGTWELETIRRTEK